MNLILSGVLDPFVLFLPFAAEAGSNETREADEEVFDMALMVVLRVMFVVSAEGGGGRDERSGKAGRRDARQRKHSPVP